jgi:hypothetical protein
VEPNWESAAADPVEPNTHSFIVKIWLEETTEETEEARWRGHVTHVPSGERRYVKDLSEVTAVLASYLQSMKVRLGLRWRIWLLEGKFIQQIFR